MSRLVATVLWGGTRDLSLEITDEFKGLNHQGDNVFGFIVAVYQQIIAGTAAHGSPVNYFVLEVRLVPQIGGSQMLHGMQFRRVHDRFLIGRGHADVKGGDDLAAHPVFAGDVDSRLQFYMVNGEACEFFP